MSNNTLLVERRAYASLADLAYDALLEGVYERRLAPGMRLKIDELKDQLQMSATPVREALLRAVAFGLVDAGPGRTYIVTPTITERELRELFVTRRALELAALSSASPTSVDVERLNAAVAGMSMLADGVAYSEARELIQADRQFHEMIVAMAHNPYLQRAWEGLHSHLRLSRLYAGGGVVDWSPFGLPEHQAIVDAIASSDTGAAVAALARHLDRAVERLAVLARQEEAEQ